MLKHIIITPCTKNKCTAFKPDRRSVSPADYLINSISVAQLDRTRTAIFALPGSAYDPQAEEHYAFDLYVRHPETQLYRNLRDEKIDVAVREKLLAGELGVDWYFLSGGYGLLHALELAKPYQATFLRSNNAPCTLLDWKPILPALLDEVFEKTPVIPISVFGSNEYVKMVRATKHYRNCPTRFDVKPGRANERKLRAALVETVRSLFKL
jgi:hypothetical protein